jgi:hypothetical protein
VTRLTHPLPGVIDHDAWDATQQGRGDGQIDGMGLDRLRLVERDQPAKRLVHLREEELVTLEQRRRRNPERRAHKALEPSALQPHVTKLV